MEPYEQTLKSVLGAYVRDGLARVDGMERQIAILASNPEDRDALREVLRGFHAFAGSGNTYGFPEVTAHGFQGEQEATSMLRMGLAAKYADLDRWRGLLAALRKELSAPPQTEPEAPLPEKTPRPAEILVVDDDPVTRETLARLLQPDGLSLRSVETKAEALKALAESVPDGLIADIVLPDGTGYEIVKHLRSLPQGESAAALVVSGLTGFLDKVEAIHCGADGYFEKPVDWDDLVRRLHQLLERDKVESARILSVEDDPHQAAFIRAVLEAAGYVVKGCTDPRQFESDVISFRPDLVLMDIVLPWLTGYDLARYLRQEERYAALPIIFLTTEKQMRARIETARAGGDEHLLKPVLPSVLLSTVAARIERARLVKGLLDRDGLTRLLTHTAFLERARGALAQKQRDPQRSLAWVMIDLDHFKSINDTYGHPVGDRVLTSLSALLRRRVRQSDTIGRYGGEEFTVLLENLQQPEATRLVSRLLEEFKAIEHRAPDGAVFRVTFSAGIAVLRPEMDLDRWRKAADDALYAAKEAGRSRVIAAPSS